MEKRWIWPFELEEQIGEGGMGQVFRARYVKNDRRVAVKLLPDRLASNATVAARFSREMEVLKDLRHPNIVHCFGGTTEGKQWFYAMELVEGGTLDDVLERQKKLRWEQVIRYGIQIAKALGCAHERGVIHRDLKPGNLLLTKAGVLKLADFGLAMLMEGDRITAAGKTMGTFLYMSPEQIRGKPPLSGQSDLYSLGCVLYELLAGQPPFVGENPGEILTQHLQTPAPRVLKAVFDVPLALDQLIAELLEKDPKNRPATAEDVAQRLSQIDTVVVVDRKPKEVERSIAPTVVTADPAVAASGKMPLSRASQAIPRQFDPINRWLLAGVIWMALLTGYGWGSSVGGSRMAGVEATWRSALQDVNPAIRIKAAEMLGTLPGSPTSVDALLTTMEDPDALVRSAAASSLGHLGGDAKGQTALLAKQARTDESPLVRSAAGNAVKELNAARPHSNWSTWLMVLCGLGLIGYGGWKQWQYLAEQRGTILSRAVLARPVEKQTTPAMGRSRIA